jgi:hypothetical protein
VAENSEHFVGYSGAAKMEEKSTQELVDLRRPMKAEEAIKDDRSVVETELKAARQRLQYLLAVSPRSLIHELRARLCVHVRQRISGDHGVRATGDDDCPNTGSTSRCLSSRRGGSSDAGEEPSVPLPRQDGITFDRIPSVNDEASL